jgi:hypothetical protein
MIIRTFYRRIDVFGYTGNTGSGDYYSGNLILTQNFKQRAGQQAGNVKTGGCDNRKDAPGSFSIRALAIDHGSSYETLGKRLFPFFVYRSGSRGFYLDDLLGHDRIPQAVNDHRSAAVGYSKP